MAIICRRFSLPFILNGYINNIEHVKITDWISKIAIAKFLVKLSVKSTSLFNSGGKAATKIVRTGPHVERMVVVKPLACEFIRMIRCICS